MAQSKKVKKGSKVRRPIPDNPAFDHANVVIGRKRPTDTILALRVSKKTQRQISALASQKGSPDCLEISEADFLRAIAPHIEYSGDTVVAFDLAQAAAPEPVNILLEANKIIYGDREQAYGNPRFNLDTIARFWTVYMQRKFPGCTDGAEFTAEDVAQLMILLKTARLIHNPTHVDSLTDQAGYAALQHRIQGL